MTYVEWLRVRGALKWTAIVLGVLFLAAAGVRLYIFSRGDTLSYLSDIENDPSSKITRSVLADGTKRAEVVDKTGKIHITVDDRGYAGQHIDIVDLSKSHRASKTFSMGSMRVEALPAGADGGERVTVDTGEPEPFIFYSAFAMVLALIVGTVLGAPFARENDNHLEIALTKPVPRIALALSMVGVDLAGIVGAWVLGVVFLLAAGALFEMPHLTFGSGDFVGTLCGLAGAFAWYAILCAATASMKRAYGVVLGLAWPFALIVFGLGKGSLGNQPILVALHTACQWLSYVLPFTYLHFGPAMTVDGKPAGSLAFSAGTEGPALAALAIVYIALAVVQWRRVEA